MLKNQDKKIYFVTGGGTGGHIYPAISIAKELRNDASVEKVYYIGNPNNLEAKIARNEGFEFLPIDVKAMPRKFDLNFLKWGIHLNVAIWKALFYLYKYKPNAVFGTGGYVSAPAIMGAILSKTPVMMHDCDAHPGIVSRYVSQGADVVSVAFEEAKTFIKNPNIKVLGNPIKQEFFNISKDEAKKILELDNSKTLVVMGGSQGAMNINQAVINSIEYFTSELDINVVLQTGEKNFTSTIEQLKQIYPNYETNSKVLVRPYFDNMAIPLKAADVVISRAGSLSLSEIAAVQVPSILIPYPYAAADHQRKNARCYEKAGASVYIDDLELNKSVLEKTVSDLFGDVDKLSKMSEAVKCFYKPNATAQIIEVFKEISK